MFILLYLLVFVIWSFISTNAESPASYKWMRSKGSQSYKRSFNYFFVLTVHTDSKLGKEYCQKFYFHRSVTEEKSTTCSCSVLQRIPILLFGITEDTHSLVRYYRGYPLSCSVLQRIPILLFGITEDNHSHVRYYRGYPFSSSV